MKRTTVLTLVSWAAVGLILGFLLDQVLTTLGRATYIPAVSLPVLLILVGMVVVALAIPVYRGARGLAAPVNPFRAVRIAVLSKASSIVGALMGGVAGGLIVFLLTRPVSPSVGSMVPHIATVVSGALLIAGGLVAEFLCTVRKDDDDEHPGDVEPEPSVGDH